MKNLFIYLLSISTFTTFTLSSHADQVINVNSSVFVANETSSENVIYNILISGDVFFVGSMNVDGEIQVNDPANLNPTIYFTEQLSISGNNEIAPLSVEVLDVGGFVLQTELDTRQAIPQFGLSATAFGGDIIIQTDLDLPGSIDLSSNGGRVIIGAGMSVGTQGNFQVNGVTGFHLESGAFLRADRGLFIVQSNSVPDVFSIFDGDVLSGSSIIVFSNLLPFPGRIFVNGNLETRFASFSGNQIFVNGTIIGDPVVGDISVSNSGINELTELSGNAVLSANRICLDEPVVDFGASINRNRGC